MSNLWLRFFNFLHFSNKELIDEPLLSDLAVESEELEEPRLAPLHLIDIKQFEEFEYDEEIEIIDPTVALNEHQQLLLSLLFNILQPGRIEPIVYQLTVRNSHSEETTYTFKLTHAVLKRLSRTSYEKKKDLLSYDEEDYRYDVLDETQTRGEGAYGRLYYAICTLKSMYRQVFTDNKIQPNARIIKRQSLNGIDGVDLMDIHQEAELALLAGLRVKPVVNDIEHAYITAQTIPGEDLYEMDNERTVEECFDLTIQMGLALATLHRKGVIHRDFKSDNVMVYFDPQTNNIKVEIIDFGLGRKKNEKDNKRGGTPLFMAPEANHDPAHADEKADIFSFMIAAGEVWSLEIDRHAEEGYEQLKLIKSQWKRKKDTLFINGIELEELISKERRPYVSMSANKMAKAIKTTLEGAGRFNPKSRASLLSIVSRIEELKLQFMLDKEGCEDEAVRESLFDTLHHAQMMRVAWQKSSNTVQILEEMLYGAFEDIPDQVKHIHLFIVTLNIPFFIGCQTKAEMLTKLAQLEENKENLLAELITKKKLLIHKIEEYRKKHGDDYIAIKMYILLKEINIDIAKAECGDSFFDMVSAYEKLERRNKMIGNKQTLAAERSINDIIFDLRWREEKLPSERLNQESLIALRQSVRVALLDYIKEAHYHPRFFRPSKPISSRRKADMSQIIQIINNDELSELQCKEELNNALNLVKKGFLGRSILVEKVEQALDEHENNFRIKHLQRI